MKKIFEQIKEAGYTKSHVAKCCAVTYPTLASWNAKKTRPDELKLLVLCELLDIYEDELDLKEK